MHVMGLSCLSPLRNGLASQLCQQLLPRPSRVSEARWSVDVLRSLVLSRSFDSLRWSPDLLSDLLRFRLVAVITLRWFTLPSVACSSGIGNFMP